MALRIQKYQYYLVYAYVDRRSGDLRREVGDVQSMTKLKAKLENWYLRIAKLNCIWRLPTEIFGEIKPQ